MSLRVCIGGELGIRTPGTFQFNGFQDRRFRPLSQPSISNLNCNRIRTCVQGRMSHVSCPLNDTIFFRHRMSEVNHTSFHPRSVDATCCRGTRIRTLTDGFGDHNATIIPYLCNNVSPLATPLSGIYIAEVGVTFASLMVIFSDLSKN